MVNNSLNVNELCWELIEYYNTQEYNEAQLLLEKGFPYLKKAAEDGNAKAQYFLGQCYVRGCGTDKNLKQAIYWIKKSAKQGLAIAQSHLANLIVYGHTGSIDDKKTIYNLYKKAAKQGDAHGQEGLAKCYYNGNHVKADHKKALFWYKKAAEQGLSRSQTMVEILNEDGIT